MNNFVKSAGILGAAVAFTGFMISPDVPKNDPEHSLYVRREYALVNDSLYYYWGKFLGTLKKLEAVVYIPEDKMSMGKRYGINFSDSARMKQMNMAVMVSFNELASVEPGDVRGAGKYNEMMQKTFKDLGLIVLVQKSRVTGFEQKGTRLSDLYKGIKLSDYTVKLDESNTREKFQVKEGATQKQADYFLKFHKSNSPQESFTIKYIPSASLETNIKF